MCVCVCVCVCVRARAFVRACVCVCVCVQGSSTRKTLVCASSVDSRESVRSLDYVLVFCDFYKSLKSKYILHILNVY